MMTKEEKQEQRCYCGNIYRLGVIHREDTFCDERPKPNYDEKKFAEFLIKECLNTIDSKSIFKDETEYEKGHNDALILIYSELVKKFGIKFS